MKIAHYPGASRVTRATRRDRNRLARLARVAQTKGSLGACPTSQRQEQTSETSDGCSLAFVEALVELCEVLHQERFYLIGFRLLAHTHKERSHQQH
jgi:hypothetical protein